MHSARRPSDGMKNTEKSVAQRMIIDYFDHNETFAPLLPRSGVVSHICSDIYGNSDWYLVSLDEPFDYQQKVGEPFAFRLVHIAHFLIRSRWAGYAIEDRVPTSVFVLLVEESQLPVQEPFDPSTFFHVCWGMVVPES
jgi:hypothetical protein